MISNNPRLVVPLLRCSHACCRVQSCASKTLLLPTRRVPNSVQSSEITLTTTVNLTKNSANPARPLAPDSWQSEAQHQDENAHARQVRTTRLRRAGPMMWLETEARTRRCLQPMVRTETTTISSNNLKAHVFHSGSSLLRTRSLLRERRRLRNHDWTSKQSTTPNTPHSQINLPFRKRSHDDGQTD